jgi:hypothetical protein
MPNPSEMERTRTDNFDELEYWKDQLRPGGIHGKETKEFILGKLHAAAAVRGVEVPGYNTDAFRKFLNEA